MVANRPQKKVFRVKPDVVKEAVERVLEKKLVLRDEWKPMDEIGEDTYKIMLSDIEMECYRVLYDRS